jgi:hypothetical protein
LEEQVLRTLIRTKLQDGRLPKLSAPRVWGGSGRRGTCAACETGTSEQLAVEGVAADGSISITLHARCFYIWTQEARAPLRDRFFGMLGRFLDGVHVRRH